jgi:hypothetical protein
MKKSTEWLASNRLFAEQWGNDPIAGSLQLLFQLQKATPSLQAQLAPSTCQLSQLPSGSPKHVIIIQSYPVGLQGKPQTPKTGRETPLHRPLKWFRS